MIRPTGPARATRPPEPSPIPPTATSPAAYLTDFGPAPEFVADRTWINSDALSLAGLRGKVVLIEFWTFG